MQQDALRTVNLVKCKIFCAVFSDDVFQVWELIVIEKCWAERYTRGLCEAVSLLDVAIIYALRNVCESLCFLILTAQLSDGPIVR